MPENVLLVIPGASLGLGSLPHIFSTAKTRLFAILPTEPKSETQRESSMKKILNMLGLLGLVVPGIFAQNTPPVIVCPAPVVVEATSSSGAVVSLTASVSDVDSNALTVVWFVDGTA